LDYSQTTEKMLKFFESQNVEVIVAITHLALKFDIELAKKFPSIHLIIGGHDHNPLSIQQGNTLILKSGHDSHYLGRINLKVEKKKHTFQNVDSFYTRVIPTWKFILNKKGMNEEDKLVSERINHYMQFLPKNEDIAICETFLDTTTETVRSKEAAFGNMMCDAVKFNYNSEIAFVNGF
jgi:2',3'-cyclic-nucleotide 2'-phosphodiesterase (5'-nucleotidase family)